MPHANPMRNDHRHGRPGPRWASPGNPAGALAYLGLPVANLTKAGSQRVDGAATTHYQGLPHANSGIQIPASIWVETQGRVRKVAMTLRQAATSVGSSPVATGTPSAPPTGGTASPDLMLHLTVTYRDFGIPVHPAQPPASQTSTAMNGGH